MTLLAIGATLASAEARIPSAIGSYRLCGPKGLKCVRDAAPEPIRHVLPYPICGPNGHKCTRDVAHEVQIKAREDGDIAETDANLAAEHATALADDDEDYDKQPDGVDDATYLAELAAKDAEDDTIPASRRRDA